MNTPGQVWLEPTWLEGGLGSGFPREGACSRAWTVDPGHKGHGLLGGEGRMEE